MPAPLLLMRPIDESTHVFEMLSFYKGRVWALCQKRWDTDSCGLIQGTIDDVDCPACQAAHKDKFGSK